MRPTTQTILHGAEPGRMGNCFQASIATLLELPLSEVPHFVQYDNADYTWLWWDAFVGWCYQRGFHAEYLDEPVERLCLVGGKSPRGVQHVCVGKGEQVVFDPHPSRDGLDTIDTWITVAELPAAIAGGES